MISLGLMSGTSMDGIDASLIETDGQFHIKRLAHESLSYGILSKETVLNQTTELHAQLIEKIFQKIHTTQIKIDVIGYHGQTTYHNPAEKKTIQLGDPQFIANKFNTPVVFNFRQNDLDHGGQGAPLAPLYHQALMHQAKLDNLAVVNIGGIANISILTKDKIHGGFDTGPGNRLLDKFVKTKTHGQFHFDKNGEFAAQGEINHDMLARLFSETLPGYYEKSGPKSLDITDIVYPEHLNNLSLFDGCATLAAFTAFTISKSVPDFITILVLCGGGAKNPAMIKALKHYLPHCAIKTADEMKWSATYMEAELIAWLAVRCVKKLPLTVPETTGVSEPMTGGVIFYPGSKSL